MELVEESQQIDQVTQELEEFGQLLDGSEDLKEVLTSPSYGGDRRMDVLRAIFEGKITPLALNFLLLLASRNRIRHFDDVLREFLVLRDEKAGIVPVHIASATELSSDVQGELTTSLERMVGKKIRVTTEVDPTLVGGMVTRVGNMVFDGSLATQFSRLRRHLGQA